MTPKGPKTPIIISGKVVAGAKRGRRLGFPTANLEPDDPELELPAFGVYASIVEIEGKRYPSATSIGPPKTFGEDKATIEVHIFDFDSEIYGKPLTITLIQYIRQVKKFAGTDELSQQIKKDCRLAREIL